MHVRILGVVDNVDVDLLRLHIVNGGRSDALRGHEYAVGCQEGHVPGGCLRLATSRLAQRAGAR